MTTIIVISVILILLSLARFGAILTIVNEILKKPRQ